MLRWIGRIFFYPIFTVLMLVIIAAPFTDDPWWAGFVFWGFVVLLVSSITFVISDLTD